jgi:hypothetical protein
MQNQSNQLTERILEGASKLLIQKSLRIIHSTALRSIAECAEFYH